MTTLAAKLNHQKQTASGFVYVNLNQNNMFEGKNNIPAKTNGHIFHKMKIQVAN